MLLRKEKSLIENANQEKIDEALAQKVRDGNWLATLLLLMLLIGLLIEDMMHNTTKRRLIMERCHKKATCLNQQ